MKIKIKEACKAKKKKILANEIHENLNTKINTTNNKMIFPNNDITLKLN